MGVKTGNKWGKSKDTDIILEYLEKFPESPSKTLAKKIYSENSTFISSTIQVLGKLHDYLKKISAPAVGIGRIGVTSSRADNVGVLLPGRGVG